MKKLIKTPKVRSGHGPAGELAEKQKNLAKKRHDLHETVSLSYEVFFSFCEKNSFYEKAKFSAHRTKQQRDRDTVAVFFRKTPAAILQGILQEDPGAAKLSAKDRAKLTEYINRSFEDILGTVVCSPYEFYSCVSTRLQDAEVPVVECQFNGHFYPVKPSLEEFSGFFGTVIFVSISALYQDYLAPVESRVTDNFFTTPEGATVGKTVRDVLASVGLRPTDDKKVAAFKEKNLRVLKLSEKPGTVVSTTKPVLLPIKIGWRSGITSQTLGATSAARPLIVEPDLEANLVDSDYNLQPLPVLRCFSPDLKRYCYIDVDDVVPYCYDATAKDLLVLPKHMKHVLDSVFCCDQNKIFGDIFRNRHGGIIVLASGKPGVGKTLTAEVYSEYTKRPLYSMEMGELGTNLQDVESNLQAIFNRARRWNAMLLFDEAEVFLSKRSDDFERSSIVGVFLRLLDLYDGILFLTTNRPEVIDEAFKSRVTLSLQYPDLNTVGCLEQVWSNLLEAAELKVTPATLGSLAASSDLNGRNIRNVVRLVKLLYPGELTPDLQCFKNAMEFVCR